MEIIEWFNNNLGPDVATYLSLALGVIALFFVSKTIYKQKNQSQNVKNGIALQAGRDNKIKESKK